MGKPIYGDLSPELQAIIDKSLIRSISFNIPEDLAVEAGAQSFLSGFDLEITEVKLAVDTAPTGAALIVDINKNGVSIYTTQENRPTIAIGETSASAVLPDIISISNGDKVSIDIEQVGSTVVGKNLALTLTCEVV